MKTVRDVDLLFHRYYTQLIRNPVWLIVGFSTPILYLALFTPLLEHLAGAGGLPSGNVINLFLPGILALVAFASGIGPGFSTIFELKAGVIERFRVTPVSRFALLLGRALRDILTLLVQSLLLMLLAIPFGLHVTLVGVLVMLGLVALIGLGMASLAYAVALKLRSEDAYAPLVFSVSLPLLLLSGVLLPLTFAPDWLRVIAGFNPLSYAVNAARDLFNGHGGDPDVFRGLVIMAVLALVGIVIGSRAFSRAAE